MFLSLHHLYRNSRVKKLKRIGIQRTKSSLKPENEKVPAKSNGKKGGLEVIKPEMLNNKSGIADCLVISRDKGNQ